MIFRIFGISAALASLGDAPSTASQSPVRYTLAPVIVESGLAALAVEMRFDGDADGETTLSLPSSWAGSDSLWKHVEDVRVEGAASVRHDGPGARVITHAPGAALAVRYRVRSGYAADPGFQYEKAWPVILPTWFFVHGEGVFAMPEGRQEAPARFAWRGVPAGWTIASDLDHLDGTRPALVQDVIESVSIGAPDLSVVRRDVGGAPLRVAVRGTWGFSAEEFADAVATIVRAENAFWGDEGRPFLVPLAALGGTGPGISYTGTHRSDAFSVASTPAFTLADATRFLAHEYMHTWIGREVGGAPERDEAGAAWITEGFTDFYAARVLLRAGVWTPADFAAELNEVLLRNASSPARAAPNAVIAERFWTDADVRQLPYDRGNLLALLLDYRIRAHTAGRADIDDVLLAQRNAARRNEAAGTRIDAATLFPAVVRQTLGMDLAPELARHVERGEPVTLPAELFGACMLVETVTQPDFHRGFDAPATSRAGNVVTGVDSTSPAYAAGLRDGMRLLRRDAGEIGNAAVELVYRVDDGGTERVIRYFPAGKGRITFQRVTPGPDAASPACIRVMGGS